MATEETEYEILAADAATVTSTITLVDAASAGDPTALRTLEHPDSTNFPIVTYNRNPDRTINFDQVPLYPPSSVLLRTLDTTQVFVTPNAIDDVLVTEIWTATGGRASMTAAQFRRLYELVINQPELADPETYVVWSPADRTETQYNVILTDLRVGGASGKLDVKEFGAFAAGVVDGVATGIIDRTVELDLKIVSEVTA